MESNKVKMIIIILALGGAVLIGLWAYKTRSGNIADIKSVPEGETVWVKCSNPACGATYEMGLKEYYQKVEEKVAFRTIPPIDCEKCGEESVYKAIKCKNCGEVFFPYEGSKDIEDKCPKCGFSETDSP